MHLMPSSQAMDLAYRCPEADMEYKPFVVVTDALARQMAKTRGLQMQEVQVFVQVDF